MKRPVDDTVLEITRILDAPPARVFGAWLNREEWQAWIGPEGISCEVPLLEPRVGGRYRLTMNLPDGKTLRVAGVYRAIDEPRRLVFTWGLEGEDKRQSLVTITVKDLGRGGSEPKANPSAYPPFDAVLQTYRGLRAKTLAFLDEIGEQGLDQPTKLAPPGLEAAFATVGQAVMTVALHQTFHNGEAAVARRASRQRPFFVPSRELREF